MFLKILILSSVILAGCCAPIPKPPQFDSYLVSECSRRVLDKSFSSWEDVLAEKAENAAIFEQCYNKHSGTIKAYENYLKEFNATK